MSDFKKAIPTEYKGIQLKSRMEAQCAFLFDQLGWGWEYEPKSIMLSNGVAYTPDFSVNGGNLIVECRGYSNTLGERQIAGFIEDLPSMAKAADEAISYLVMGPDECVLHRAMAEGGRCSMPARLTYCVRCDEWRLDDFGRTWKALCPACIELTFNQYSLTVNSGKFLINGFALSDKVVTSIFDRQCQLRGWMQSFLEHVCESMGRYDLLQGEKQETEKLASLLWRLTIREDRL